MSGPPALKRAMRWALSRLPEGTTLPVLSGPLRGARWIAGSSGSSCWAGFFERENQRFIAGILRPGDVFVDVGAHVGFFALLGARRVGEAGRVIAVEPLPRNLVHLERHLALNRLANVEIRRCALSDASGRARFGWKRSPSHARLSADGDVEVEVRTLDALLEELSCASVRLIKVDVEGAEPEVLSGATRTLAQRPRPSLSIATHGWRAHTAVIQRLASLGYAPLQAELDESSGNGSVRFLSIDEPGEAA